LLIFAKLLKTWNPQAFWNQWELRFREVPPTLVRF